MKTYDLVKHLLEEQPELRDSDRKLLWQVWKQQGIANTYVSYKDFMNVATSAESITRARRKIQELHPKLRPSLKIAEARTEKANTKGTFIFNEETQTYTKL